MKAWKLFNVKPDGIHSLFIDKSHPLPMNEWLEAECHPTKGFAVREGWHCTFERNAPHLKINLASGQKRVWALCEVENYRTYDRPESQGGAWILADRLKILELHPEYTSTAA